MRKAKLLQKNFASWVMMHFLAIYRNVAGGHPEWHILGDCLEQAYSHKYDLMIAHPPCTYLTCTGARWLYNKDGSKNTSRWDAMYKSLEFVKTLMEAPIESIAIENPVGLISSHIRKPDQIVQPYLFGDPHKKTTCLWLKNLPPLKPTEIVDVEYMTTSTGKRFSKWYWETSLLPVQERSKARSKTFSGMAKAIAQQWGKEYEIQTDFL